MRLILIDTIYGDTITFSRQQLRGVIHNTIRREQALGNYTAPRGTPCSTLADGISIYTDDDQGEHLLMEYEVVDEHGDLVLIPMNWISVAIAALHSESDWHTTVDRLRRESSK